MAATHMQGDTHRGRTGRGRNLEDPEQATDRIVSQASPEVQERRGDLQGWVENELQAEGFSRSKAYRHASSPMGAERALARSTTRSEIGREQGRNTPSAATPPRSTPPARSNAQSAQNAQAPTRASAPVPEGQNRTGRGSPGPVTQIAAAATEQVGRSNVKDVAKDTALIGLGAAGMASTMGSAGYMVGTIANVPTVLGAGMIVTGATLSVTGVGAAAGIPMMVAGAKLMAAGIGVKVATRMVPRMLAKGMTKLTRLTRGLRELSRKGIWGVRHVARAIRRLPSGTSRGLRRFEQGMGKADTHTGLGMGNAVTKIAEHTVRGGATLLKTGSVAKSAKVVLQGVKKAQGELVLVKGVKAATKAVPTAIKAAKTGLFTGAGLAVALPGQIRAGAKAVHTRIKQLPSRIATRLAAARAPTRARIGAPNAATRRSATEIKRTLGKVQRQARAIRWGRVAHTTARRGAIVGLAGSQMTLAFLATGAGLFARASMAGLAASGQRGVRSAGLGELARMRVARDQAAVGRIGKGSTSGALQAALAMGPSERGANAVAAKVPLPGERKERIERQKENKGKDGRAR